MQGILTIKLAINNWIENTTTGVWITNDLCSKMEGPALFRNVTVNSFV